MGDQPAGNALPENHQLHWYSVQRVLGIGGFGITYLARDMNLERLVAIKEYVPGQLAARAADRGIQPLSGEHAEDFQWGLRRFIDEARTLTRFEHPNVVRVLNVFEMHGTAYMVMTYETGESLQQVLKRERMLSEARLVRLLVPLLSGLELIHSRGFVHRDIKPANIFIREDGSPVLLDFGSARQTRGHSDPQTLTTLVSPGYAPIEQYTSKSDRQGPWTDIYGMGATLYRAVSGSAPSSATDRSAQIMQGMKDDLPPLSAVAAGRYSPKFLAAVDHALAFRIEDRPQSIAAWRLEFAFDEAQIITQPDAEAPGAGKAAEPAERTTERVPTFVERRATSRIVDREAKTEPIAPPAVTVRTQPLSPPLPARRKVWALAAAGAVVLIGLVLLALPDGEPPESGTPASAPAAVAEQPAGAATAGMAPETPAPGDDPRIAELLALADADIAALRLMSPKGNNAYERYQDVLQIDPANQSATDGLRALSQRYVDLAYGAMAKNNLDDATIYLLRAGRIEPSADGLPAAREALSRKFAEVRAAEAKTTAAPSTTQAKKSAKRDKRAVPVEDKSTTASDRVKKSLGEN
jgi:hypothetical protein